jgi:hypothetical protein
MKTFVKRPDRVLAIQWTGDNAQELLQFIGRSHMNPDLVQTFYVYDDDYKYEVCINDWVIRKGRHITKMSDQDFRAQYDEVKE